MNFKVAWHALVGSTPTQKAPIDPEEHHDQVKSTFVNWTATIVPFALGILLAISNGYFFSGFHDFSLTDINSVIAWGSGFAIEAATLACVFNAALRLRAGDKRGFRASFAVGLLLCFISFTAQYVFLQMQLTDGTLVLNDTAIDKMPIFNLLVGVNGFQGHDLLFLIRSGAYHVTELACTFLIAKTGMTHAKKLEKQRQDFEHRLQASQQEMALTFMEAITETMKAHMDPQRLLMQQQFTRISQEPTIVESRVTAEVDTQAIADALAERSKKEKALWKPVPQQSQQ